MSGTPAEFQPCEICGSDDWRIVHDGPVRDGAFGNLTKSSTVARCRTCGVDRLDEGSCRDEAFYQGTDYRESLEEGSDAAAFFAAHDVVQNERLSVLWPESLRGKTVADIGCGGGSFLDHVSGLARQCIAIEPGEAYHTSLADRGYRVYPFGDDAAADWSGKVDWAFSFDVIEHVGNPRDFLDGIASLLKPDGKLMLSTPNRNDALMDLATAYPPFFYRAAHRWYFDGDSLATCAERAGLQMESVRYVQRYGLANATAWMRDGRPSGRDVLPHLDEPLLDRTWQAHLEQRGVADRLYAFLMKKA